MSPAAKLTRRERDVVRLRRSGKSYKDIGYDLGIAPATARVVGARALRKLGGRRLRLPKA